MANTAAPPQAPEDDLEATLRQTWGTRVRVDVVMALLGLSHCSETLVGDALVRGISGGERKRLTSAEMLVRGMRAHLRVRVGVCACVRAHVCPVRGRADCVVWPERCPPGWVRALATYRYCLLGCRRYRAGRVDHTPRQHNEARGRRAAVSMHAHAANP